MVCQHQYCCSRLMRPGWCSVCAGASSTESLVEQRGSATVSVAPVGGDEGDGEAIMPFAADGLDRRGAYARLRGQQFVEAAHALDVRIAARGVGHRAFAHDVIGDD